MADHHDTKPHDALDDDTASADEARLFHLIVQVATMIVDGAGDDETAARCKADAIGAVLASCVVREHRKRAERAGE